MRPIDGRCSRSCAGYSFCPWQGSPVRFCAAARGSRMAGWFWFRCGNLDMKVSVILPTYEEAGNIVALVERILQCIPKDAQPEIIVVDDNSPDGTYRVAADRFANDARVVLVLRTA